MAKDAVATMGTILTADVGGRDAVHVAVIAVTAGSMLSPGQHVGIDKKRSTLGTFVADRGCDESIGIVDPFLGRNARAGERFWLYLYPRTITSLRHNWTHPAFEDVTESYSAPSSKIASEKWLRDFVAHSDCPGYEILIATAIDQSDSWSDDYLHFNGVDAHGDIPPEMWDHIEVVTGKKIINRPKYFSCSC